MLDTVLMDVSGGGQAERFFFTDADGSVQLKAERLLSLKSVEKELRSGAATSEKRGGDRRGLMPQQPSERVIAMARTRSGDFVPLTSKALHTIVKAGSIPANFDCLQPFKRAKDYETTSEFANYQHRYILDDTGGGVSTGVTHRRVAVELSGSREGQGSGTSVLRGGGGGGGGGRTRSLLLSKNARVNTEVAAAARSVAVAIERSKLCRVLRLDTEFVLDEDDELWLAGVTLCEVAARPSFAGTSEARSGQQGEAYAHDEDRALATELRSRKHEAEQALDVINDAKFSQLLRRVGYQSPTKGRAGGRPRRRSRATVNDTGRSREITTGEDRTGVPGETTITSSQGASPNLEYRPGASSRGSAGSATAGFDWASPDVSEGSATSELGQGVDRRVGGTADRSHSAPRPEPVDRFNSSIVRLDQAATNRIYGSTQVEGCRGDFCDFDVDKLVREEEDHRYFVEKAARAAGAPNGLVENLSPLRLKIVSMDEEDLGDGAPASSKTAAAAVVRPGGRGPRVARHRDLSSEQFEIPYKAVVQARQERPLVEAFLRQYARGQNTAYHQLLDGHEGEEPYLVGGKYPGVYYRPVRVCPSCHKVYTLVDEARARALRNLRPGDDGSGRRQHPGSPRGCLGRPSRDTKGIYGLPSDSSTLHAKPGEDGGVEGKRSTENPDEAGDEVSSSKDGYEHSSLSTSLVEARQAMDAISQGDISELRSFVRPPAAVAHVASVAMSLLQAGSTNNAAASSAPWEVARAAMGRGDFLTRLRAFDPRTVTPQRIRALVPALERSSLDPAVVRPLSNAAGNLCLWILGTIQANRWLTGSGHTRTNTVPAEDDISRWGFAHLRKRRGAPSGSSVGTQPGQPFPQQHSQTGQHTTSRRTRWASPSRAPARRKRGRVESRGLREAPIDNAQGGSVPRQRTAAAGGPGMPGPATASPTFAGGADLGFSVVSDTGDAAQAGTATAVSPSRRPRGGAGRVTAQAFASGRLANAGQAALPEVAASGNGFVCADGRTRLPYRVCGDPGTSGGTVDSCNFVVVHDIFDNVDKTEVLFRPVTRRHHGCRVLTFSYPGQAGTVFRVPPSMLPGAPSSGSGTAKSEAERTTAARSLPSGVGGDGSSGGGERNGVGKEVPNNAFIASKLHELLQHVHAVGEMSLAAPFHLVGIGNGMPTAAAFALRYGDHPLYRPSLRSVISINGFSSVDSQLAAVLHSSLNAFATLPPNRPDLPISFMSRYIFSEEYLKKVGRNLALGIYTAVANPVSLEGRYLLCSSALLHEDLSGEVGSLGVPLVLLQSTEDILVNPANVDPFLRGRSSIHHFWSHEFRNGGGGGSIGDGEAPSSAGPGSGSSVYGRKGLTDLLRALSKPRGTFVAWVRAGHEVCQEGKRAVVDLLDALAKPTHDHNGVHEADLLRGEAGGAVTLGLYPSGEWVARVNKRGGGRAVGEEGASLGSAGGGAAVDKVTRRESVADGSDGVDADLHFDRGQREKGRPSEYEGGDVGDDGDSEGGTTTSATSPFPRDISIPTLPANIMGRHQAPNTSPIKRSQAASFRPAATVSPGRGIHRAVVGHGSGTRRQARSVDAFGLDTDETVAGKRSGRHGRRQRSGRSRDQDLNSRGVGGALATRPRRPKVVWKDPTPAPSATDKREVSATSATALPSGSRNEDYFEGRGSEIRGHDDYSTSYFPAAALLYDNDGPASPPRKSAGVGGSANPSAVQPKEEAKGEPGGGVNEEDPWDLVKNAPSLEFPPSGQHQRGNRRWVVNKRPAAAAAEGVVEDSSQAPSSMPTETMAGTASSAQSGGAGAAVGDISMAPLGDLLEAEASLQDRLCEARRRAAERLVREDADAERRIAGIAEEQRARSRAFAREDREMIAELEKQLAAERLARAPADLQRAVDGLDTDDAIVREGLVGPVAAVPRPLRDRNDDSSGEEKGWGGGVVGGESCPPSPVRAMPPLDYSPLDDLPEELRRASDAYSVIDDAARDEAEMLRVRRAGGGGGPMDLEKFQRDQAAAASEAAAWRLTTKKAFRKRSESEVERARVEAALRFQPLARGVLGRKRARRLRDERDQRQKFSAAAIKVQTMGRILIAKGRARAVREAAIAELVLGGSALRLQSVGRGMLGRRRAARRRREVQALTIQRCYRGHLGRRCAAQQRTVLEHLKARNRTAVRLQAWWRCRAAVSEYARTRATSIAAVEIQRCYRGMIGRKKAARRLEWERSEPGPERLKLGVRLIEDSKAAFEAQRMEIAALHTAGERAVVRTSRIRRELGTSEKELTALEREMTEIDHIEEELSQLSHQRNLVQLGLITAADTMPGVDKPAPPVSVGGNGSGKAMKAAANKELGFALEMQIQIKRAEREKKRQELEADFVGVREEVELKRRELERVVAAITEIEFTRERKTAEFHRMQTNLMELLREQKHELDLVKEKGVQLEVATATSAAAASATAQRAKDHEERSAAMYSQTEELMKFQFMSMSLSYFSSLNMLKTMRDINADTTTAAVTSSADAAAAAAASAAAANLPSIKAGKVLESVGDVVRQEIGLKTKALQQKTQEQEELEEASAHPFPQDVRFWTKEDVGHFLVTLGLQQYRAAFAEAAVDGDFLLALNANDCADVLGVEHVLHSKKLFLAIDKLRPLSGPELQKKAVVEREDSADAIRGDGPPDVETVFSQVRNARLKRLEDSLERGFYVDAEDEFGNTALMVACQNCNSQLCEMLLRRGANVNHQNGRGNTPLHYAMAYDPQGVLGEMLISRGGDDTITNIDGLSCYDGLGGS